jgi:internalin A
MTKSTNELTALRRIEHAQTEKNESLDLSRLELKILPAELYTLTWLKILNLSNNQLTSIDPSLGHLTELRSLLLQANPQLQLPDSISNLLELEYLDVTGCQLETVPDAIKVLINLKQLNLGNNRLRVLPKFLGWLPKLARLETGGNPITFPPPEIVDQGTSAILEYCRAIKANTIRRQVAKMVLVGEPKTGKTTLFRVLKGRLARPDEEQTHGISVESLALPYPSGNPVPMHLNTWDFGGQQSTMQLISSSLLTALCFFWYGIPAKESKRVD